jgi:hypothetical protein
MNFETRLVKAWILISVVSLFVYCTYQLVISIVGTGYGVGFGSLVELPNFLAGRSDWRELFLFGHVFGELGLMARFAGVVLALTLVSYVCLRGKTWESIAGKLAWVVLLEAVFFLGLLGTIPMLIDYDVYFTSAYLLQAVLVVPTWLALSWRLYRSPKIMGLPWKFMGLALLSYVAAMWVNNVFRWASKASAEGVQVLFSGADAFGFLETGVLLSLALVFALLGFTFLMKDRRFFAAKLIGFAFTFVGIHFLMYIVYVVVADALGSLMLVEVWALPLLGLGLSLVLASSSAPKS